MTEPKDRDLILVPIDFSDVAAFATDHAIEIARLFKHRICLLHVAPRKVLSPERQLQINHDLEHMVRSIRKRTRLNVSYKLVFGVIHEAINEAARHLDAEFVVMGIHGKKGREHLTGTVAYKVVRESPVPVLLVKHMHHHKGYKNIVLPVDFSKKRAHKIEQAIRFGKYFGATIRVFGYLSTQNKARIIKKEALLKGVGQVFAREGIPVTTELHVNPGADWADTLIGYAEGNNADLIMIVANRGGRLSDWLYSNATVRIIDSSEVPILTVAPRTLAYSEMPPHRTLLKPFVDPFGLLNHDDASRE